METTVQRVRAWLKGAAVTFPTRAAARGLAGIALGLATTSAIPAGEQAAGEAPRAGSPPGTPAIAPPPDACFPSGAPLRSRIAGIVDATSLALADGTLLRLADIGMPQKPADRAAVEDHLGRLLAAEVELYPVQPEADRYGRVHGHLVTVPGGTWLQADLVGRGLVFIAPDAMSDPCAARLLQMEATARAGREGIWDGSFRVAWDDDRELAGRSGQFAIVEGEVATVGGSKRNVYLNFGTDWSVDFTVIVPRETIEDRPDAEQELEGLAGRRVRVRGYLESWNGPMIRIEHPAQLEVSSGAH